MKATHQVLIAFLAVLIITVVSLFIAAKFVTFMCFIVTMTLEGAFIVMAMLDDFDKRHANL